MRRLLFGVVLLAACGGDAAAPALELAGTYTLSSVDRNPLPAFAYQTSVGRWEITGGTLTLTRTTFRHELRWRVSNGYSVNAQTSGSQGSYSGPATALRFESGDASFSGTARGDSIAVVDEGRNLVYRRTSGGV